MNNKDLPKQIKYTLINKYFIKLNTIILTTLFLSFLNTNCEDSTSPIINDDEFLIALSQIDPQFSYDNEKIVFKGVYNSLYAIHFIDISGNYLGNILSGVGFLTSPSWSPEDEKLAVSIEGNIYITNTHGDILRKLTNTGQDFHCNWSPDGRYIAYTKSICDPECGIVLYDLNNDTKKVVGQYGGYASWNRNSDRIYYYHTLYKKIPDSDKSEYKGFVFKRVDVNTLKTDSLYFVDKTDAHLWLEDCTVSPDEDELLFSASYGSPPIMNIWKIDLETGEIRQITTEGGTCPSYSFTGDKIVYTNTNINEGCIWIMNKDGSNKQRLTKPWR